MFVTHKVYNNYEANNLGIIRHVINKRPRKMRSDKDGYLRFNIKHEGNIITLKSHSFIADIFCEKLSESFVVDHINNDKKDNRAQNLCWVSNADNITKAHVDGLHSKCHPVTYKSKEYWSKNECFRQTGVML